MKKTILAIGTHPDDIEIGCGGMLAILKRHGHELVHLVVTSGEEGGNSVDRRELGERREVEARASARLLGANDVIFFREDDGLTTFSKKAKLRLISLIRQLRPDIVFTHAKSDHFPDHHVVYQLTKSALLAAAGPWYPEAGAAPHMVKDVYGYEVWNPIPEYQVSVDISSVIELKIEALQVHQSQIGSMDYLGAIRGLAKYRGIMSMAGQYAEVFEVLKIGEIQ
jgi:LmbE family N-acetylglucosaminyl deacetylase